MNKNKSLFILGGVLGVLVSVSFFNEEQRSQKKAKAIMSNLPEAFLEDDEKKSLGESALPQTKAKDFLVIRGIKLLQFLRDKSPDVYMEDLFRTSDHALKEDLLQSFSEVGPLFGGKESVSFEDIIKGVEEIKTGGKLRRQSMLLDLVSIVWVFDSCFDVGSGGGSFSLVDELGIYKKLKIFFDYYVKMSETPEAYQEFLDMKMPQRSGFILNRTSGIMSSHYVKLRKICEDDPRYQHYGISIKFKKEKQNFARILKGEKAELLYGLVKMLNGQDKLFFKTERNPFTTVKSAFSHIFAFKDKVLDVSEKEKIHALDRQDEKNLNITLIIAIDQSFLPNKDQVKKDLWTIMKDKCVSLEELWDIAEKDYHLVRPKLMPDHADMISGNEVMVDLEKFLKNIEFKDKNTMIG